MTNEHEEMKRQQEQEQAEKVAKEQEAEKKQQLEQELKEKEQQQELADKEEEFEKAKQQVQEQDANWVSGQEQLDEAIEGNGVFDQATAQIVGAALDETVNRPPEIHIVEYTPEQIAQQEAGEELRNAIEAAKVDTDVAVYQHEQDKAQIESQYNEADYTTPEQAQEQTDPTQEPEQQQGNTLDWNDGNEQTQELEQPNGEGQETALEWNNGNEPAQEQDNTPQQPDSQQALQWNSGSPEQQHDR